MIPRLKRLARFILDLLFPPRCVFCGEIVPPGTQVCRQLRKNDCTLRVGPQFDAVGRRGQGSVRGVISV